MTIDSTYGSEWGALEALCRDFGRETDDFAWLAPWLAAPAFDWGRFLEHALTHKLQAVVAYGLLREPFREILPRRIRGYLHETLATNRHKIHLTGLATVGITLAGQRQGLTLVPRKGLIFEHTAYLSRGTRYFSDVDFMIHPEDHAAVTDLLTGLGYQFGDFDMFADRIAPTNRALFVTHKLNPDHLPEFVAPTNDRVTRFIKVDVASSMTWTRSEYTIPLNEAFAALVEIPVPELPAALLAFAPVYQFIDAVMHLFREAYVESTLQDRNPVTLSAFLDVLLLWRHNAAALLADGLPEAIARLGIERPVSWVLAHLDRLFEVGVLGELALNDVPDDEWLGSWRPITRGESGIWHGDMRRRLAHGGCV